MVPDIMRVSLIFSFFALVFQFNAFSQARVFEPGVISNDQVFGGSFTPDGKEVYFTAAFGGRDSLQIHYSKKIKGIWEKPQVAPFADKKFKQIDPFVSPDGTTVLYNSASTAAGDFDIYAAHLTPKGWSAPVRLGNEINTAASEFYATMCYNGNIYFTRRNRDNDIYVSRFVGGKYQPAELLDSVINAGSESNPYISPEEDYLIFFSDRKGGYGDTDLYISFNKNGKWSIPQNLGSQVNSAISEFCPGVDQKNELFFFSRTEMVGKQRVENIYYIKLKELNLFGLKNTARYK
jgi:Tol biopolymer transport system component